MLVQMDRMDIHETETRLIEARISLFPKYTECAFGQKVSRSGAQYVIHFHVRDRNDMDDINDINDMRNSVNSINSVNGHSVRQDYIISIINGAYR